MSAKFNPKASQLYMQTVQAALQSTEETATHVAPFFEKLVDARDAGRLADMPAPEFLEIKAEFDDAVAAYEQNADRLTAAQAPVKLLGAHKTFAKHYRDYAAATAMMANALQVDGQTIDTAAFEQSEQDQETYMMKFQIALQKVMAVGR